MKYRLIELKLSGIKCIEKEIEIFFAKRNFDKEFFDESIVKSIYGPNGSGKTAVVSAFSIYRTLLTSDFPFKMNNYEDFLGKLINKKTNTFKMSVVFAVLDEGEVYRLKHEIIVSKNLLNQFCISHESLYYLNTRLNATKLIFETNDGVLTDNKNLGDFVSSDPIVISNNSFIKLCFNKAVELNKDAYHKDITMILFTESFAAKLFVAYGDKQDAHIGHFADWAIAKKDKLSEFSLNEYSVNRLKETAKIIPGIRCFDVIFVKELEKYEKEIKKMASFVKLLKQDLRDIKVEHKPLDQVYIINLTFVYDGYEVDFEFESTGVKKLCLLYSAFVAARNGSVVLIDEIDSNIHDTFLVKLFEYFISYSNAQIICTTHNVEIMSVISSRSKSIDFLSNDNRVIPWIKTGRLSPATLYLKGRIKFIPFNLDSSEFAEVFNDE